MTLRRVLIAVVVIGVAVVSIHCWLARSQFDGVKNETRNMFLAHDWGQDSLEKQALTTALAEISYSERAEIRVVFATVKESLISKKLESLDIGTHMFELGWFDLDRQVNSIRFALKSGSFIDFPIPADFERGDLYCHELIFLGRIGIDDGRDIRSVLLMRDEVVLAESPMTRIRVGDMVQD